MRRIGATAHTLMRVLPGPRYVDATPVPADVSADPWDAAAARWRLLHGVIWWPPDQPESTLVPEHHVHTLRRLVQAPWPRR